MSPNDNNKTIGLSRLQHIVVLMLENRSFDQLCGLLYTAEHQPQRFFPADRTAPFNGYQNRFVTPRTRAISRGKNRRWLYRCSWERTTAAFRT